MKFIQGQNRTQTFLFPISIDQSIAHDNEVRLIDMFVDKLDLGQLGFDIVPV
jgi:transposase